jgi:hypothetical protein
MDNVYRMIIPYLKCMGSKVFQILEVIFKFGMSGYTCNIVKMGPKSNHKIIYDSHTPLHIV